MKEFIWKWIFWASVVFCSSLSISLLIAYLLYSTAPSNEYTPVFASGFGFAIGFFGLGGVIFFLFDKLSNIEPVFDMDNEIFNKVVKELPFLFFALLYFFTLAVYMGLFMIVITYIKNSCV